MEKTDVVCDNCGVICDYRGGGDVCCLFAAEMLSELQASTAGRQFRNFDIVVVVIIIKHY